MFYLHKSVSISTRSCQSQSCVRCISAVIIHVVDGDIDDIDTVAIAIDVDSPAGTGLKVADDSLLWVLERTAHVGQVEMTIHWGQRCCWCRLCILGCFCS